MEVNIKQPNNQPILLAFGVNHKTASIEVREKLYIHEREMPKLLEKLKQTLSECVILSTCNRTEIYGVHPSADVDFDYYQNLLIDFKNAAGTVQKEHFFTSVSCAACRQIFNVATSIDSKVIGDTQILQQLRQAYTFAKHGKFTGKILNQLLQRAFKIGKKARFETSIHKGAVSMSLAAVELARQAFGALYDKKVLVIGAGETARLTAECLLKKNVKKIIVANRTKSKAEEFLSVLHKNYRFESGIIEFKDFHSVLNTVDIVISSTGSPDFVLLPEDFAGQTKKILVIDLAVPRDVAPEVARNAAVTLKNIDDLNLLVDKNYKKRMVQLPQVKKIVAGEMADFLLWYYTLPLLPSSCKPGAKPDFETIEEIKQIRIFLLENAAVFHKMARQKNVRGEIKIHLDLVNSLFAMKRNFAGEAVN